MKKPSRYQSGYSARKAPGLDFDDFRGRVKQGEIDPLYLFTGPETYLRDQAIRLLIGLVDEDARPFNFSTFEVGADGGQSGRVSAASAIDTANMSPMASRRRVVIIRGLDKIKDSEVDLVEEYLKRPSPMTVVAFDAPQLDQRKKISDRLSKHCTAVRLEPYTGKQAERWAGNYMSRKGCRIQPEAIKRLIELAGPSMSRIAREMDKVATYAGTDDVVGVGEIEQLVGRVREHSNFELWNSILEQDRKKTLTLLARLLKDGTDPFAIIGALASLYRRMLVVNDLVSKGAGKEEVQRATGQYGDRAEAMMKGARRVSRDHIVRTMCLIAKADNDAKNSIATPQLQIECLVARLIPLDLLA